MNHFNVSLTVLTKSQDSVYNPQFLKRKESRSGSNRGPSAYQPSALPLGHTGSHDDVPLAEFLCTLYLPACQVTANLGKSGLCSCVPCNTCNVYRALLMPVVDWTAAFVSRNVMQGNSDTKDTNDSQP